ncbi:hypothetical protein A6J71_00010 [Enterobacter cancerogenus]|uniref:hypothetical protein n=1 Tax=Enterobacter cancerogenus TaxID=69218 RepID=UPI000C99BE11|nr:hypothetical protein [Enterobacter cancerogenus]PNF13466.1 hypothetical protein A6J71_00010 [Enterobacter cancerogenus]
MSDLILTKNFFLKYGLESLNLTLGFRTGFIFIDLDSFHSLKDVLEALRSEEIRDNLNICLVGSGSVNYKVLNVFNPIALRESVVEIRNIFSTRKFHKLSELVRYIYSIERLSMLTNRERESVLIFKKAGSVNVVSKHMKLTEKTMYTLLRSACNKINLKRLIQLRKFLSSNSFVSNER